MTLDIFVSTTPFGIADPADTQEGAAQVGPAATIMPEEIFTGRGDKQPVCRVDAQFGQKPAVTLS